MANQYDELSSLFFHEKPDQASFGGIVDKKLHFKVVSSSSSKTIVLLLN